MESVAQAGDKSADNYFDRVAKYVPAEIVGAYVAGQGVIVASSGAGTSTRKWAFGVLAVVLAVLTPLYLRQLAGVGTPWGMQAAVATVSFLIWVYALGLLPIEFGVYNALAGSLVLILFSVASGLLQPREIGR